jgi:hypothetical protein
MGGKILPVLESELDQLQVAFTETHFDNSRSFLLSKLLPIDSRLADIGDGRGHLVADGSLANRLHEN